MVERYITLRGKEYAVRKSSGVNVLGLIKRLYFNDDLLDPAKMPATAAGIKRAVPNIPDALVSEDSIYLQPEELYKFVDDFREIYFLDNLEDVVKQGDYLEELNYAKGFATFQAYREVRETLRIEREKSWNWEDIQDVRPKIEDVPHDRTWFFFLLYYTEQQNLAMESGDTTRKNKLEEMLNKAKKSFDTYVKTKPSIVAKDSSTVTEQENAELKRRLAELEKAQPSPVG